MQKTILIYALGAVVLVGAILYAVSLSPIFKTQGSATAVNTPNAPETPPRDKPKKKGDAKSEPYYLDDSFFNSIEGLVAGQVPEGRDHLFYARLRARLSTELARLQDGSNDAARQALEERIATVDRNLLFVEDTPYQQRIKPLFEYCKFLMNKRDVAGLVALQKEVENANWKEAEEKDNLHCRNLAFIPKTYRVKTEIAKAIDEKDDQRLESFFPELEALAMEDRDNPVDSVRAKLKDYLDPIANYSQELGNKAKIAMRRGFYRAQLRLNDESLTPKYSPKNATILVGGSELSYDQTLLDVPKDETTAFYKARIAQLQNLLMRVPADSDAEPVKAQAVHNSFRRSAERRPPNGVSKTDGTRRGRTPSAARGTRRLPPRRRKLHSPSADEESVRDERSRVRRRRRDDRRGGSMGDDRTGRRARRPTRRVASRSAREDRRRTPKSRRRESEIPRRL